MKPLILLLGLGALGMVTSGCTNAEGRFRPIDPLGRAIFDALDRGPSQPRYAGYGYSPQYTDPRNPPGPNAVWVEGTYGTDASGRRVWIPGHWTTGY